MPNKPAPKPLLIDCDPGLGVRGADVDDNLAILLALASPEVDLLGVTVTHGNTPLATGVASARATLDAAGSRVPLLAGADGPAAAGTPTDARDYLIDTVMAAPGTVHLLTLGPVTNIATAMQLEPRFAESLASLTLMGGAFRFPWFGQRGDPNFRWDTPSALTVMNAPLAKTLITMDVCVAARFTRAHQRRIKAVGTPLADYIADGIDHWLTRHRRFGLPGFFPWDVVALAWLLDASLFGHVDQSALRMRSAGPLAARMRKVGDGQGNIPRVAIPQRLDGPSFMRLMVDRLAAYCGDTRPTRINPAASPTSR